MAKSLDYPGLRQQRRFGAKTQLREPAKTQLPEPAENKDATEQSFLASDIVIRDNTGEEVGLCDCDVDLFNEYDVEDKAKLSERISQVHSQRDDEQSYSSDTFTLLIWSLVEFIDYSICFCAPTITSPE